MSNSGCNKNCIFFVGEQKIKIRREGLVNEKTVNAKRNDGTIKVVRKREPVLRNKTRKRVTANVLQLGDSGGLGSTKLSHDDKCMKEAQYYN